MMGRLCNILSFGGFFGHRQTCGSGSDLAALGGAGDFKACRHHLFDFVDMADQADQPGAFRQLVERIEGGFQSLFVELAKAFIDENRIELNAAGFRLDDIGQAKCQRQSSKKTFPTR